MSPRIAAEMIFHWFVVSFCCRSKTSNMTSSRSLIETQRCRETDFLVNLMIKLLELPAPRDGCLQWCGREYPMMDASWQWPQYPRCEASPPATRPPSDPRRS